MFTRHGDSGLASENIESRLFMRKIYASVISSEYMNPLLAEPVPHKVTGDSEKSAVFKRVCPVFFTQFLNLWNGRLLITPAADQEKWHPFSKVRDLSGYIQTPQLWRADFYGYPRFLHTFTSRKGR